MKTRDYRFRGLVAGAARGSEFVRSVFFQVAFVGQTRGLIPREDPAIVGI